MTWHGSAVPREDKAAIAGAVVVVAVWLHSVTYHSVQVPPPVPWGSVSLQHCDTRIRTITAGGGFL